MINRYIRLICTGLLVFTLIGCSSATTETTASNTTKAETTTVDTISEATMSRYRENELREYQGQHLDPAIGPADNSISGVKVVSLDNYQLTIDGLVEKPVKLSYDQVLALPPVERLYTLHCVTGWDANIFWKGVLFKDLFAQAGGAKSTAKTVIFRAVDGYSTSLPLALIIANDLMLAYDANGLHLPAEMGYPFIVVAEDKWGYKWARWVSSIELSANEDFKGYWEQAGYDNNADVIGK